MEPKFTPLKAILRFRTIMSHTYAGWWILFQSRHLAGAAPTA
jgi:hypothetical protein